jgi:hypothetical protein
MATPARTEALVSLRPVPYPYRAMLAVCSDLDETPDRGVYWDTLRFLNTTETTPMGEGVGLEVGNSLYFDMAPDQFAYWTTDDAGRDMLRALVRSGHVDCFHSYGDLATTRAHAARALEELTRHGLKIGVWVDHAVAPTNFGADIMRGRGDLRGSAAYHADLTCGFGVEYVWRGRITSVAAQDVPRRLGGLFRPSHPWRSGLTLATEWAKGLLARVGHRKYALHPPNELLRKARLRDGREVWEFLRCNPYWGGVDQAATADGFAAVMDARVVATLVERGGRSVLYTHLGKVLSREQPLGPRTREAFARLADEQRRGRILVTTTSRLLAYSRTLRELSFATAAGDGELRIEVTAPGLGADCTHALAGLSFDVPDAARTRLFAGGREVAEVCRSGPDGGGRSTVSLPWRRLEFPRP